MSRKPASKCALRASKNPNARFAVLYQNDDAGKDYLRGVKEALGADADKAIAMATSFEVADPTVDSQILTLANTKADVFLIYSVTPRACAQAIRKASRDRLAADALHFLGLRQQGNSDGAGRARGRQRHHVGRVAKALLGRLQRPGPGRLPGFHEGAAA